MRRQSNQLRTQARRPNMTAKTNQNQDAQYNAMVRRNRQRLMSLTSSQGRVRLSSRRNIAKNNPRGGLGGQPIIRKFSNPNQVTKNGSSRIIHREPLLELNGSINFAITTFNINPGLFETFPWLSAQASGYESYKVNSLTIEYKHTINEFHGQGLLVIAPDYDSADTPPISIIEAEQMIDSKQGAVTRDWSMSLRPRGIGILGPKRYTRSSPLSPNEDIKTYDVAQVHICTQGQEAPDIQIGQLWISYDITLTEPQPLTHLSLDTSGVGLISNSTGAGVTPANLLGNETEISGPIVMSHNNNIITFHNLVIGQQYIFHFHMNAATVTTQVTTAFTGFTSNSAVFITTTANSTIIEQNITANAATAMITLGGVTVATTPSESLAYIFIVGGLDQ